jgi:hypothetical protein
MTSTNEEIFRHAAWADLKDGSYELWNRNRLVAKLPPGK